IECSAAAPAANQFYEHIEFTNNPRCFVHYSALSRVPYANKIIQFNFVFMAYKNKKRWIRA
ncbi:MAG: hypothetical protein ACW7DS_17320, partial [Paraglaciecola chathamensis]